MKKTGKTSYSFDTYLHKFEKMLCEGIDGRTYTTKIEVKPSKLSHILLQGEIDTDESVVVSYYGIQRRGRGQDKEKYIIHFSQVKLEHIMKLAPSLITDFMTFKQQLINLRWK